jgi:hypothetical protein
MNEHNKRICKRCASKPKLTQEDIDKMVAQVTSMKGVRLADEGEYEARMRICAACDKFEYGSTCTVCGCVMQVRARLADGRCPYPANKKW